MDASDKQAFGECLGALFAAFDREATKALLTGYWWGLQDMQLREVQEAALLAMQRCRELPKPIELRELVRGTAESRGELAWIDVIDAVYRGPYKNVDFENRTINAVVRALGGWPTFCARFSDAESEKWARIEFVKCYSRLSDQRLSDEAYAALPGLSEISNEITRIGRIAERRPEAKRLEVSP